MFMESLFESVDTYKVGHGERAIDSESGDRF